VLVIAEVLFVHVCLISAFLWQDVQSIYDIKMIIGPIIYRFSLDWMVVFKFSYIS